jgi:hypothetical protein
MSVRPYFCPYGTTGSCWAAFHAVWYLRFCPKSVENIYVLLKFDTNSGHCTWTRTYIYNKTCISLNFSWNEMCFGPKLQRKSKHPLRAINIFCRSCRVWDNIKSIIEPYMLNMPSTVGIDVFPLEAGLLARGQYSEDPPIGHLDTGFSWFPWVFKQMLIWFPRLQVATTCFSCNPPHLNLVANQFYVLCTC